MGHEKATLGLDHHDLGLVAQRAAAASEGNEFCLLGRRAGR